MKKSLVWTTVGIAVIGLAAPALAARNDSSEPTVPSQVTVTTASAPSNSVDSTTVNSTGNSTANSVEDVSGPCDEAEHANDPRCSGVATTSDAATSGPATSNTVTDNSVTDNSVTDNSTASSVEDVSGPCDEAEHANDSRCTGGGNDDNSGHSGGDDDNSGHGGDDDNSGHGGSNDD